VSGLLPLFLRLEGRSVVVVGAGPMGSQRVRQLAEAGARVTVIAPEVREEAAALAAEVRRRPFVASDLDGAWLAVAAATPEVNAAVAAAAEERRLFVNAVDDPDRASAYTAGVVRRGDVTVAISTGGRAPALAGLLREALDALLPADAARWADVADAERPRWKRDGVPLAERRPLLLEKLNALYRARVTAAAASAPAATAGGSAPAATAEASADAALPPGFVSLVGAGPGDPGLLTRRAAARLATADVVLYDARVDPAALALAPRAHAFPVGKRAGRPSVSQRAIERLLVRCARRGQRVVRLKCGDPFVFGRGGEEAEALAAAGIPFEVVPGVSSAVAAPALAGIPVTHRGTAAGFAVVSGHAERSYGPLLDALAPAELTVVVLMGLAERARIARRLLGRGWSEETPAAIVLGASGPSAHAWRGTLAALGDAELPADLAHLPGILVVGGVAALAHVAAPRPSHDARPDRPLPRALAAHA
jgi:uroporphyrin-III C-methyltransferase/precorrin-2 dehydrogenase/sirohydrochlorin ferrochelatase